MNIRLFNWLVFFCILSTIDLFPQNNAFQNGEELIYTVNYSSSIGILSAGKAVAKVELEDMDGLPVFRLTGIGETNKLFDVFYKVRDRFESKTDTINLLPYFFSRRTREGNFSFDDEVVFDRKNGIAYSSKTNKPIPENTFDMVSAVYFMRTLSLDDFGQDSIYLLNFHLDDSVYHSVIKYLGKALVETKWGWLPCLKIKPMLILGEVFSNKYPMSVWITDDENHIPVLAESELVVGSVRVELVDYGGLKHPFIQPLGLKELKKFNKK